MGKKYKPKVGDRVRVVLEGRVDYVTPGYGTYIVTDEYRSFVREEAVVSVEKVEPPVEVFKPGDVVRYKAIPKYTYAVGKYGYMDLYNAVWNDRANEFTSENFEKVSLR